MNIHQFPWETVKLKDLCEIQLGRTPLRRENKYWDEGTNKWLSISDMNQGRYIYDTSEYMTDYAVEDCNVTTIPVGTVLLSFKLSIGRVSINEVPLSTNEAIAALLIEDETELDRDYLYWVLQVIDLMQNTDNAAKGKTLNKGKMKELYIPLPPLQTQKKIAAVLDKADTLRQKRRQTLAKLDELTQSVFLDMFGDPFSNPKNWKKQVLKNLGKVKTGSTPSTKNDKYFDGNIPFITPSDLSKLPIKPDRFLSQKGLENSREVRKGTTMVCCIGATIGKVGITNKVSGFNQQINSVEWNNSLVLDEVGYYGMIFLKKEIIANAKSTTLPILKKSLFEEIEFPIMPIELQKNFVKIFHSIQSLRSRFIRSEKKLGILFNSLLQKAFKGELHLSKSEEALLAAEEAAEYEA